MANHSVPAGDRRPAGFISPHLDDVVLSCSGAITAGSVIVTVFASGPRPVDSLPAWDLRCGFAPGDDVSLIRHREDDAALAMLGARGERLNFWPNQYRAPAPARFARVEHWIVRFARRPESELDERLVDQVASDLASVLDRVDLPTWYAPLGVGHLDHRITSAAVLRLARAAPERQWILYEDLPYARQGARLLESAHRRVAEAGYVLTEAPPVPQISPAVKRSAVACYASQVKALGSSLEVCIASPETFHALADAR